MTRIISAAVALTLIFGSVGQAKADVTFGYPNDLGTPSTFFPNYLLGESIKVNQTVSLLNAGIIVSTDGYNGIVGLYSNNNGIPNQLLATTGVFTVTATGSMLVPFTSNPVLAPGTYWFMADFSAQAEVESGGSGNPIEYDSYNFSSTLPTSESSWLTYAGPDFNYFLDTAAVPEPSSFVLLALVGVGGFVVYRCRRKAAMHLSV